jgi:uncharacterized protein YlaN (UPF0358 family)
MKKRASEPIKQHYVPQSLLRNFTFGKKAQVYVFDKHAGSIFSTNIINAAAERKFNEYVDGEDTISIEAQLERLEAHCVPIFRGILDTQNISGLSVEDRAAVSLFVAVQYTRTNYQRNLTEQINRTLIDVVQKMGGDPYKVDGFSPIADDNDVKRHAIQTILRADELVTYIIEKPWLLLKTEESEPFFISDHPVTLQNHLQKDRQGSLGLGVEGIEIYMPLSKTLTLAMLCPIYEKEIREAYKMYERSKAISELLRLPSIFTPEKFDPQLRKLLEGMDSGNAVMCSRENVMNLNYLQVVYSSRFVYSSIADFSLAKQILQHNPKL